ncbi:MAG: ATP-dependent Clp protease proteolytic subunit [Candidatus Eisenbacteria sp.]|nr:ATP-dependent Clp protease proteolytic subunit [Candidatus Eisenbacteria bacterium]
MRWHRDEDELIRLDEEDPDEDEEEEEQEDHRGEEDDKLQEKMLKTRTVLVSEAITDEVARKIFQQLLVLESDSKEKPITVVINSPGGEADSGFGIHDMLRFVEMPVRTLVAGLCASAAVIVFLAGDKGKRFSLPNSRFLLHQPSSQSFGQASDLEIASKEIAKLRERYNRIVADKTGRDIETITKDSDRDFWLSAKEAKEYGLVEHMVTHRSEIGDD